MPAAKGRFDNYATGLLLPDHYFPLQCAIKIAYLLRSGFQIKNKTLLKFVICLHNAALLVFRGKISWF